MGTILTRAGSSALLWRLLLVIVLAVSIWLTSRASLGSGIAVLDVGQGDALLLQSGNVQVLIDGGPGTQILSELGRAMPRFNSRVDVVMVTHPQQDHLEGLLSVVERYDVGLVVLPRAQHNSQLYAEWVRMLTARHIPYRFAWRGQRVRAADLEIEMLAPFDLAAGRAAIARNLNNASIVARATWCPPHTQCLSALLTGDAEREVERLLVTEGKPGDLRADILKVGHHGSNTSTTGAFVQAVKPRLALISVGVKNRYHHPSDNTLRRLTDAEIWRTDEHGTISVRLSRGRWQLRSTR